MKAIQRYTYYLQNYPLSTRMISAGVTASVGDFLCQALFIKYQLQEEFCFQRTWKFFIIGSLNFAPALHIWFSKILPRIVPQTDSIGILKRVVAHALLFMPFMNVTFFPFANFLDGKSFEQSIADMKQKCIPALLFSWKLWPLVQLINFTFVPPMYHVLFTNFIQIFFNGYLSYLHNSYNKIHHIKNDRHEIESLNENLENLNLR
ncbi:sym1p [Stylonychia lemnae]|uniref:Sym1p n=1 Tax=Stylonychia lemnae TaxID=5949 RepID=A0A078ABM7_STYLE|nr:sym1p [Stylonychia lemnae]|eukprot:CDW78987.1 sym1p [Stylonychia lemnae]